MIFKTIIFLLTFFLSTNSFSFESINFKGPKKFTSFTNLNNTVLFPEKIENLNPAVIILPTCDGVKKNSLPAFRKWAKLFNENGYAVLLIDHYAKRGGQQVGCDWMNRKVSETRMVKDLYDGIEFLSKIPNINKNRIFSVGFSLGAMTIGIASSKKQYEKLIKNKLRPRAVAGLYGACHYDNNVHFLFSDTDLPLLWLMGDKDTDTPASDCYEVLNKIKKSGNTKIFWHTYPNTYHCWDCKAKNGFVNKGHKYFYNKASTEDSEQRVLKFFNSFK